MEHGGRVEHTSANFGNFCRFRTVGHGRRLVPNQNENPEDERAAGRIFDKDLAIDGNKRFGPNRPA